MAEEKYLNAVKNLVPIEQDENLSDFEKEVDGFFNYILLLLAKDVKEVSNMCDCTIQEYTIQLETLVISSLLKENEKKDSKEKERIIQKYMTPPKVHMEDRVVLIKTKDERYTSSLKREEFYKAIEKVTEIYNSIGCVADFALIINNYTSPSCAELGYELNK